MGFPATLPEANTRIQSIECICFVINGAISPPLKFSLHVPDQIDTVTISFPIGEVVPKVSPIDRNGLPRVLQDPYIFPYNLDRIGQDRTGSGEIVRIMLRNLRA